MSARAAAVTEHPPAHGAIFWRGGVDAGACNMRVITRSVYCTVLLAAEIARALTVLNLYGARPSLDRRSDHDDGGVRQQSGIEGEASIASLLP